MKKILTILLTIIALSIYGQYTPADSVYNNSGNIRDLEFGDSAILFQYKFNAALSHINDSFPKNDTLQYYQQDSDTNTFDGTKYDIDTTLVNAKNYTDIKVGEIDSIAEVASDDTLNIHVGARTYKVIINPGSGSGTSIDSLQSFKYSKDTIRFTCLENPHDTINLSRVLTLFLDTTNAYGNSSTARVDLIGEDNYGSSVTFTTNAGGGIVTRYNRDSLYRDADHRNRVIMLYSKNSWYRDFEVIIDTLPMVDITVPYSLSAEVGTYNDSIVVIKWSEEIASATPNVDSVIVTEDADTVGIAAIVNSNDTSYVALDSTIEASTAVLVSYNQDITGWKDNANNLANSWTDTTVTNNVTQYITDPTEIAGCLVAYNASDIDADGTDNSGYSDSEAITTIYDYTTNNNDATNSSGDGLLNKSTGYIDMDGSHLGYVFSSSLTTDITGSSYIFVMKSDDASGLQILAHDSTTTNGFFVQNNILYYRDPGGIHAIANPFDQDVASIVEVYFQSNTCDVVINGVLIGDDVSVSNNITLHKLWDRNSTGDLDGRFYMFISYDNVISESDRTDLRNYINNIWNIY